MVGSNECCSQSDFEIVNRRFERAGKEIAASAGNAFLPDSRRQIQRTNHVSASENDCPMNHIFQFARIPRLCVVLKQRKRLGPILNWNAHFLLFRLSRGYWRARIGNNIQIGNQLTHSNARGGKEQQLRGVSLSR
jgi:hypothetical protein